MSFEIISAIDLIDGQAVRLSQGDYTQKKVYANDPLEMALRFEDAGIRRLHLVDLDGAKAGSLKNLPVLERLAKQTKLQIDFGGGIACRDDLQSVFDAGAEMAAIGSLALKQSELFAEFVLEFGAEKIFTGADVRNELIAVKGWTENTSMHIDSFIRQLLEIGVTKVFCTDIQRDGRLSGPSTDLYKRLLEEFPKLKLTASGGVSCMDDLHKLKATGCSSAIIGKAYYEGKISLKELQTFNA